MSSSVGRFGKYTLLRRIAQGGMGEVWLARQQGPGGFAKTVAVKMLLPHLTEDKAFVDALLAEAALTARLTHRNIAQVFDFGLNDETGSYFLTMEYVAGRPLHRLLQESARRGERLEPALARDLVVQLCDGLAYAHNLRGDDGEPLHLVHRDLNPANVLVSYNGDVKIIDWGIAKSEMSSVRTETGTIKGKFVYMSPEQSAAKPIDRRSDIFALGITLHELLTGANPFQRANVLLSLEAIQKDDPPLPGAQDPLLTPFDDVLRRALAKAPEDRFADASEMAEALRDLPLPPPRERLGAFMLRLFPDQAGLERPEPSDLRRRAGSGPHAAPSEATHRASLAEETQAPRSDRTVVESETRRLEAGARRPEAPASRSSLVRGGIAAGVLLVIAGGWLASRASLGPGPAREPPPSPVGAVPARAEPSVPTESPPVKLEPSSPSPAVDDAPPASAAPAPSEKPSPVVSRKEAAAKVPAKESASATKPEPAPVVVVTKAPVSEALAATVTVSAQERGRLILRSSPTMAMTVDGRSAASGVATPLMREAGLVEVGDAGDPLRVHVRYRVVDDGVEATVDSTPWSIVEANGERGRTPRRLKLAAAATILDLSGPDIEPHVKLTLRYQASVPTR
ncbi:MAG: hypothetical protein RL199_1544 [Pseudomonadota bacterium]|jgi:serine/threonine protein kinase